MATDLVRTFISSQATGSAAAVDTNLIEGLLENDRYASLQIGGTFVADIVLQTSNDGTTWTDQEVRLSDGATSTPTVTITAAGLYEANIKGLYYRLRTTAYTSGTATVAANFHENPQDLSGGAGDATAANQTTQITNFGAQADAAATTDTGTFSLIALIKRLLTKLGVTTPATPETLTTVSNGTGIAVNGQSRATFRAALTSVGTSISFQWEGSNDNETTYEPIGETFTWFTNRSKTFQADIGGYTHVRPVVTAIDGGTPSLATQITSFN